MQLKLGPSLQDTVMITQNVTLSNTKQGKIKKTEPVNFGLVLIGLLGTGPCSLKPDEL